MAGAARPFFSITLTMPQSFDLNRNHFELFGVPSAFDVDMAAVERAYREIQAQVHPDRFAHLSDAERRASMQWAIHVNGAFQTLKSPLARAKYLIELAGGDAEGRNHSALPPTFLAEQMEWREKVEAARVAGDLAALSALDGDTASEIRKLQAELGRALDRDHDAAAARSALFRLMFLDKLRTEIHDALEALEADS
jgi:molecular chaperone HscB